ncbi:MAG: YidH family protein [Nocardioidaceae bacterium]
MDNRFQLANERTFLAYVRTALALQVAGLAVLQFLTQGSHGTRILLGLVLVAVGSALGVLGIVRYRDNDRALRDDRDIEPVGLPVLVTTAVVVAVPLLAAVLVAVG